VVGVSRTSKKIEQISGRIAAVDAELHFHQVLGTWQVAIRTTCT
jgi:hypothetical protein